MPRCRFGFGFGLGSGSSRRRSLAVPQVITNKINTTVIDTGGGVYTIQKTAGADSAYNASAVSSAGIAGDFTLRLKSLGDAGLFAGLNAAPLADDSPTINFAWQLFGNWAVCENGAAVVSALAPATYAWIWRRSGTIGYGRGSSIGTAMAAPDRTTPSAATLFFDSSFFALNEKIEAILTV